ncbi:disulfide bond formation protein DsbA [Lacimonas salitolerans]|uniref:Disulfide bond formation protein DsbA n=1 Tax=Lacimonas salitolerans TaxID=1323750 RepID=A0ABW4EER4_9RHOB
MRALGLAACALLGAGTPLVAQTDFTALTAAERAAFHAEIRAVLLADPNLVDRALAGPSPFADAVDSDLSAIDRHADTLFPDGAALAVFTSPDCTDCDRALEELAALAQELGVSFTILDMVDHGDLAAALELDMAPSYVFPRMMVRGHVPPVVLRRYLE